MSTEVNAPIDKVTAREKLAAALQDASRLLQTGSGSSEGNQQPQQLKSVLESRLSHYYASRNQDWLQGPRETLQDVELLTALEASSTLERIQALLAIEDDAVVPAIGTRDLSQIRTLLSLMFKWGTEPLLNRVKEAWFAEPSTTRPSSGSQGSSSKIVDLSDFTDEYRTLSRLTLRVFGLILPGGAKGKLPQSLITTTLLNRNLVDVLQPAFALGWLPRSMSTEDIPVMDALRPLVMRLLSILPTSQIISTLGNIISSSPPPPVHVFRVCTTLLSRQLLRQDGVQGLFAAVFGEEEATSGDIAVEKLEHVATLLNAVPANMKPQDYFEHVIPRSIALLSEKSPPTYRRAAAFTVSRMLSPENVPALYLVKANIAFGLLHDPLLHVRDGVEECDLEKLERPPPVAKVYLRPDIVVAALLTLLSNADPSPSFMSRVLSPIFPALYSLLYHLNKVKTSDPKTRESLLGMLMTWGKTVTTDEGLEILWSIVRDGQVHGWKTDLEGHIRLTSEPEPLSSLSLLTPDQVPEIIDLEEPDFDANIFDLYPDPLHFVGLLKNMDRSDISSGLFVRLLESYRSEKSRSGPDSLRILLYLQIIMQMQKFRSEGTTSNILKKPQQLLAFIHHVLDSANTSSPSESRETERSNLEEMLRVTSVAPEVDGEGGGDSDDDMSDSEVIRPDDELLETAISLLLSVLEADEDLSARTMPTLNDIFSLLEPLSKDGSPTIRPLAREARLVMTARLASTPQARKAKAKTDEEESAQEVYQKALKLLQDPILPVRAHGLLLLRQLVTVPKDKSKEKYQGVRTLDPALTPAILSIFLQSVQDEDSYIFLNSVQGLAAMADGLGREVLKGLVEEYASRLEGLGASTVTQQEVDVRTRVGEALGIVIKRCGNALGLYVDILVPPLFKLVRTREIPTTLRTSAISLLADCTNTYPLAMLAYIEDLAGSMIDLLQIESNPIQQQLPEGKKTANVQQRDSKNKDSNGEREAEALSEGMQPSRAAGKEGPEQPLTMDEAPTSNNSKFPPLRRAALHFLSLLTKEATQHVYESTSPRNTFLSQQLISKALVTLGYIASTDEDDVVRIMAREAKEQLVDLQRAKLGL